MQVAEGRAPVLIKIHPQDNVAIVASDGGLPAGTVLPDGLRLAEAVPQGHKVALADLAEGDAVASQRFHLRHAAAGRRHEPACFHHRPWHALRAGAGAGDQGGHALCAGAALA